MPLSNPPLEGISPQNEILALDIIRKAPALGLFTLADIMADHLGLEREAVRRAMFEATEIIYTRHHTTYHGGP